MGKIGAYDGLFLGALLGLIVSIPKIGETVGNFISSIIPSTWLVFGSSSLTIITIVLFALIGLITDKTSSKTR